jgi:hypothetical protein
MLRTGLLHRIIAHNIFPKKEHFDEVTLMDMCLIDCVIRRWLINLLYIMIRNTIMPYDQKQKSISYGQALISIF